ncbi:helix-turn-helix domain-containing protein [uncultured Alistipes sp.]|uniref:helix-turn-helix domain-containing protein n=1 Tax=uncultured Alistipes sp. TaxID=538949 RepID=UPI00266EC6D8|nr:helix-turn-helix domain-containing protein [uncultured Alistipes sp.]
MVGATVILDKIKSHYSLRSNVELAEFLGVSPQVVSNWYSRNTINFQRVIDRCSDMDLNWLFSGGVPLERRMPSRDYRGTEAAPAEMAADVVATYDDPDRA